MNLNEHVSFKTQYYINCSSFLTQAPHRPCCKLYLTLHYLQCITQGRSMWSNLFNHYSRLVGYITLIVCSCGNRRKTTLHIMIFVIYQKSRFWIPSGSIITQNYQITISYVFVLLILSSNKTTGTAQFVSAFQFSFLVLGDIFDYANDQTS